MLQFDVACIWYIVIQLNITAIMKTLNTTQILLKSIDIELKKQLQKDLQAFRIAQLKKQDNNQGNKQAA